MAESRFLGPCVGYTDHSTTKIWMRHPGIGELHVSLHAPPEPLKEGGKELDWAAPIQVRTITFKEASLCVGLAEFESLQADTIYYYKVWKDAELRNPLDLDGLDDMDLHFRTLPNNGPLERLDFLLMSCHDPSKGVADGEHGFKVWKHIPEILRHNEKVRFAILGGDQIYADKVANDVLKAKTKEERVALYLKVYDEYWSNIHYRRVLCAIPSVMMWDDHDIIDGWGSVEASYESDKKGNKVLRKNWIALKEAATIAFRSMQAIRNPAPLSLGYEEGHDACFRVGSAGFILADLRHNRDRERGVLWTSRQFEGVQEWVRKERGSLDTLFFLTPVTFAHGDPKVEESILGIWWLILWCFRFLKWLSLFLKASGSPILILGSFIPGWMARQFDESAGDLRDDINDGWGAPINAKEAHATLSWLFSLQNPQGDEKPMSVVLLSGDIHTSGYSSLYSRRREHVGSPVIPHIVASPVAYSPFPWLGEAYFRSKTKHIHLGENDENGEHSFGAQVSHHHCHRNVAVVSLRRVANAEKYLKVKFYLEDWPEPQIQIFDLDLQRTSHLENLSWCEAKKFKTIWGRIKQVLVLLAILGFISLVGFGIYTGLSNLWTAIASFGAV